MNIAAATPSVTLERVTKIICEQLVVPDGVAITPETKLKDDLGADSLDSVELVMALEDEFGIDIPDDEAEVATSGAVQALLDVLAKHGVPA